MHSNENKTIHQYTIYLIFKGVRKKISVHSGFQTDVLPQQIV